VPEAIAKLEELRPGPGKTFKDCAACPTMVSLAAGTAELGAQNDDAKAKPNEKPARPVTFTNLFAVGVTEVTFDQYGACVSAGGCKAVPNDNGWGKGTRPVINVSWSDAVAYAQWLSNTTGKNYGLPSGAQWEYAARGGKTDTLIGGSPKALCAFANGASQESGLWTAPPMHAVRVASGSSAAGHGSQVLMICGILPVLCSAAAIQMTSQASVWCEIRVKEP